MGGRTQLSSHLAHATTIAFLTVLASTSCQYEAKPPPGGLNCAATNAAKRCPDGYSCYRTVAGGTCADTCWKSSEPAPTNLCATDAAVLGDTPNETSDLGGDQLTVGGSGGTPVATGGASGGSPAGIGGTAGGSSNGTGGAAGSASGSGGVAGVGGVASGGRSPANGGVSGTGGRIGNSGGSSTGGAVAGSGGMIMSTGGSAGNATGGMATGGAATGGSGSGGSNGCPQSTQPCPNGFACSAGACKTACAIDADCDSVHFCGQGICRRRAIQVEAYSLGTCALLNDGTVWCWGRNDVGQLGVGTMTTTSPMGIPNASAPALLPTGDKATAIRAGRTHICALLTSGAVYCWGYNASGALGDGTSTSSARPVRVQGLPLAATSIAAGGTAHTCAVLSDSSVWCWGNGSAGQLGDGILHPPAEAVTTPTKIPGLTNVRSVEAGDAHTCALTTPGAILCWGANPGGQVGVGTIPPAPEDRYVPSPRPTDITAGATLIALGGYHSCAILNGGRTQCWGTNGNGQLGDGTMVSKSKPVNVVGLPLAPLALDAGFNTDTCILLSDRSLWCWGSIAGVLSAADPAPTADSYMPVRANLLAAGSILEIGTGTFHTCAVLQNGSVSCWGENSSGQLGSGTLSTGSTPVQVIGW